MMKRVIWRANQVISIETRRRDENRKRKCLCVGTNDK